MKTRHRFPLHRFAALGALLSFSGLSPASAKETDSVTVLKERERKVTQLVERVMGATVAIKGEKSPVSGSGVIVDKEGLILTAAHVTEAAGEDLIVVFSDGREVKAKSLGANRARDAGMARIATEGEYPFVELGSTEDLALGAWCVALGHPGGYDSRRTPPVRLGRVWSKKTVLMLGSDCTLIGGDSGGPLFDLDGKLIGIHSSIGGGLAENRHVPIEVYRKYWDPMLAGETTGSIGFLAARIEPDRPMLGVQFKDSADGEEGVLIAGVIGKSPAEAAGLKEGDRVLAVDGKDVKSRDALMAMLKDRKVGDALTLTYEREGMEVEAKLALAAAETLDFGNPQRMSIPGGPTEPEVEEEGGSEQPAKALFGVLLDRNEASAEVIKMIPGSAAEEAGIQVGDVILRIGGDAIGAPQTMIDNVAARKPGETVDVVLRRGTSEMTLKLTFGSGS